MFWVPLLLGLAFIQLDAQTRGGVMDGDASMRHLFAMGVCLLPMACVVAMRAYDAGASGWLSVLAIPAAVMLFPFSVLVLGLLVTSDRRAATRVVSGWWLLPAAAAGVGASMLVSLVLR